MGIVYLFLIVMILSLKVLGAMTRHVRDEDIEQKNRLADSASDDITKIAAAAWAYHQKEKRE